MLGDQGESLLIVKSFTLSESLSDKVSFVVFNESITTILDLIHPFTANRCPVSGMRNQIPSVIVKKSTYLYSHGLAPMRMLKIIRVGTWLSFCGNPANTSLVAMGKVVKNDISISGIP